MSATVPTVSFVRMHLLTNTMSEGFFFLDTQSHSYTSGNANYVSALEVKSFFFLGETNNVFLEFMLGLSY